jgi:hypothetical protein
MYAMSNKIYQKVASLSITHIKRYFNACKAYLSKRGVFRHGLMVFSLMISVTSLIIAILALNNHQEPALIEIYCPLDFNETIEKVRGEIERLQLRN